MRILELVFRGVAGSPELTRLKFGPGNVVVQSSRAQLPLGRLLSYALYDESLEAPPELRGEGAQSSRVGVTLQDHKGSIFRILRDLEKGTVQLARYDADSKSFSGISSNASETSQYLRGQARLAPEDLFSELLWLSPEQLPTKWVPPAVEQVPQAARPRMAAPVMGGAAAAAAYEEEAQRAKREQATEPMQIQRSTDSFSMQSDAGNDSNRFDDMPLEQRKSMLADLEKQKATLDEADQIEYAIEGKQSELFELEQSRSRLQELEKEAEGLRAEVDKHALPEELEAKVEGKLKEYRFQRDKHEKALKRITEDKERLADLLEESVRGPLHSLLLQIGAAGALLFTLTGLLWEPARWLLFLNPVALGLAAIGIIEWIGKVEDSEALLARKASLEELEEKEKRKFGAETTGARLIMEKLDVDTPEAVEKRLAARRRAIEEYEEVSGRLEDILSSEEHSEAEEETKRLEEEIKVMEQRLRDLAAGDNPADLMRDIEALRASIEKTEVGEAGTTEQTISGDASWGDPLEMDDSPSAELDALDSVAPEALEAGRRMPDPGPRMLSLLSDATLTDPAVAGERISARLDKYVAALSRKKWESVRFHGRGNLVFFSAGSELAWDDVPQEDIDTLYLAVRLCLAEAVLGQGPQPLVFEEPFDEAVDRAVWPMLARMLGHLGGLSQVIHTTPQSHWSEHCDRVLSHTQQ